MRTILYIVFLFLIVSLESCQDQRNANSNSLINSTISVDEFETKLTEENVQLIDVRTAEEFDHGHLRGAVNYNINAIEFKSQVLKLDKSKPVLVYCLSGGRSAAAAEWMASNGFKEIYNMRGGIIKWNAANKLTEVSENSDIHGGLSIDEFNMLVRSKKFVLVDYNAEWCKPCKKMTPMLEEFAEKQKTKLVLIKIDADENKTLLKIRGIEMVPVLELYREGKLIWRHDGEIDKTTLEKEINF